MRIYGLEEAQALLPEVIPVLERMQAAYVEIQEAEQPTVVSERAALTNGHGLRARQLANERRAELTETLRECTDLLAGWGIPIKDPARGLIDFYHEREGETVFLCFVLGETEITHWHTLEGGFAGRQPLD